MCMSDQKSTLNKAVLINDLIMEHCIDIDELLKKYGLIWDIYSKK